jgi:hypothetical protein
MVRYLCRSCPRCNGYVGIIVRGLDRMFRFRPSTATAWAAAIDSLGLSFEAKKFHHRANGKEISRQNPERFAVGYRYG